MSSSPLDAGGAGSFTHVEPHDPDEPTPSRVYINNVRLPSGNVSIHARKEGPLDVTRYMEGEFASPWNGEDYASVFAGLSPTEQSSFDTVRVDVRDRMTGTYYPAFYGIVTGVGNAATGGSSWYHFRAQGPGHLLSNIPASVTFENISPRDALDYVVDRLNQKVPFPVGIADAPADTTEDLEDSTNVPGVTDGARLPGGVSSGFIDAADVTISSHVTFQFGKDTLADVIDWIGRKSNLYIWLSPTTDGVLLTARTNPPLHKHRAHYLDDGDTFVVNNDALSELRPVNTLVVKAPAKKSVKDVNAYTVGERGPRLVAVKARHTALYERSGRVELHAEPHRLSSSMTKDEVENEARKLLKKAIDETTAGDMQTLLRSPVTPYDTIEALPTCDGEVPEDATPLTYEVSRVEHEITANDIPETKLNVGLQTDPQEDIEILDSWKPSGV